MALPDYLPVELDVGSCPTPDQAVQLIKNTRAIFEDLRDRRGCVFCRDLNCSLSTDATTKTDYCVFPSKVAATTPFTNNAAVFEKHIFFLELSGGGTFINNGSEGGPDPEVQISFEVWCIPKYEVEEDGTSNLVSDGDLIWGSGFVTNSNYPRTVSFAGDCPRSGDIVICMRQAVFGNVNGANYAQGAARVCGGVLRVEEGSGSAISVPGFYCPGDLDPTCRQGKESLYLASQNVNALCQAFADQCVQGLRCEEIAGTDTDEIIISASLPANTTYAIFGRITICYRSTSASDDGSVSVTPRIGCGSQIRECATRLFPVPRHSNQGTVNGPTVCSDVSIVACGECRAGETLSLAFFAEALCNEDPGSGTSSSYNAEIVSIDFSACALLFENADASTLPTRYDFTIYNCLPAGPFKQLTNKIDQLHDYTCNRNALQCNDFEGPSLFLGDGPRVILRAAQQWPPTPPPVITDPAPIKKWITTFSACIFPFGNMANASGGRSVWIRGTFIFYCGGLPVAFSQTAPWLTYQTGGTELDQIADFVPRCVEFNACIDCDIDKDLEVEFIGEISAFSGFGGAVRSPKVRASVDLYGFCF